LHVDWDGSGTPGPDDEWIELYNKGDTGVSLAGWQLDDVAAGGSAPYMFRLHQAIPAHSHLVVFKRDTGVALNDGGDSVRLLRPDGSVADAAVYAWSPGYDRTWSRTEDGAGEWTSKYEPTMGEANEYADVDSPSRGKSAGPVSRDRVTLTQARALPANTLVLVTGQLTVPPGVLEGGTIYIQDGESGIKVYCKDAAYSSLAEGDWVQVEGRLTDFHGEREITITSAEKVQQLSSGPQLVPMEMATGELAELWEGRLVAVAGRVTGWDWDAVYLNDGSGDLAVYFGRSLLVEKPWVEKGELYLVVGVASQYASARPYQGGYRILPRYARDVTTVPAELPATGAEMAFWTSLEWSGHGHYSDGF
jgi:DNA/RNA endonuclease YhcR with UshA esterase domain